MKKSAFSKHSQRFSPAALIILACAILPDAEVAEADSIIAAEAVQAQPTEADSSTKLRWISSPSDLPVTVLVSTDPSASAADMEVLASELVSGEFKTDVFKGKRVYFALQAEGSNKLLRVAPRLLPLEGGRNFRDIGGYKTEDGRTVKWGKVYRSGVMNGLTAADYRFLDQLDVVKLVDLRNNEERESEPTHWIVDSPEVYTRDYTEVDLEESSNALLEVLTVEGITAELMRQQMASTYYQLALDQAEAYTVMFDSLAKAELPLVFNCSAGKDRTGIAAALLYTLLGVPRETIIDDYALSDNYADFMTVFDLGVDVPEDSPYAYLADLPKELMAPMMASYPEYIVSALNELDRKYGSVMNFIQQELDVSDEEIASIRAKLLTD